MCIILPMLLVVWFLEHLLGASPAEHRLHKAKQEAEKAGGGEPNVAAAAIIAEAEGARLADTLKRRRASLTHALKNRPGSSTKPLPPSKDGAADSVFVMSSVV